LIPTIRLEAGCRYLLLRFDRPAVDDAVSDMLGRQVSPPFDFSPATPESEAARAWTDMVVMLSEELFCPDSALTQSMACLPFAGSLVRGVLIAADHPRRGAVTAESHDDRPQAVRTAIEIMEAEAHTPLSVAAVAAHSHMSVRALQKAFRRHLQISPMAYLRDVRLRRAHQDLVEADPSVATVASICHRWSFTNPGRFAALHTARYGEPPNATLRRIHT